ncbi:MULTISPECIES: hypothetical protein [unclassified Lysobacter]|uniref:M61 family metallopeptidase n=1 Tax=unclassified Lysobacter TaxID=2635362 RepID=UPI001BECD1C6|nr:MULTISPECIES: hypothetical protein [unclassified Lysobacter]MBT2747759.1 hypothetical protein [Lysobacter sp. ISL-42]MBT2753849.1 hypothetical protein [Lysobacter sp. ISL-50]MBT2779305.1 hypothetical protein [Lysobacter sp. ISL-54]MBT2782853.1 hypothetical protein [Lysobacter sp. ISL-52]
MTVRALSLPTLLVCAALAASAGPARAQPPSAADDDAGTAARGDERVIRAGDTRLHVIVENAPSRLRADELQRWLAECANAALTAFGRFPLHDAQVRIRLVPRRGRDSSPVPWGQTVREDGVSVLLYVREDAGMAELRGDWTAVHELSHLFHPYLGDDGRWLAEGLASYYQNVLRARAGLLDADEAWRRLDGGFQRGRRVGPGARMDEVGWSRGSTMRIYWAGAAFWLDADVQLRREHGTDLDRVLGRYSQCCLDSDSRLEPREFIAALDRAGGRGVFARLYRRYAAMTGFPSQDAPYRALGISESDKDTLRFSDDADAVRLRRAIMAAPRTDTGPAKSD